MKQKRCLGETLEFPLKIPFRFHALEGPITHHAPAYAANLRLWKVAFLHLMLLPPQLVTPWYGWHLQWEDATCMYKCYVSCLYLAKGVGKKMSNRRRVNFHQLSETWKHCKFWRMDTQNIPKWWALEKVSPFKYVYFAILPICLRISAGKLVTPTQPKRYLGTLLQMGKKLRHQLLM